MDVVEKRKQTNSYTSHQQKIKQKLKKWYGNVNQDNLDARKATLKLELKSETEKLRLRKEVEERKRVNYQFKYNPKQVYREFKGETKISTTNPPSEADIKDFWSNIWSKKKVYNVTASWLEVLEHKYCTKVTQKHNEVNLDIFLKILTKMKNNTAPGIDLIVAYWWKKLFCIHGPLVEIFKKMFKNEVEIPQWAPLVRTSLLAKNKNTHEPKNYRPIALCLSWTPEC